MSNFSNPLSRPKKIVHTTLQLGERILKLGKIGLNLEKNFILYRLLILSLSYYMTLESLPSIKEIPPPRKREGVFK